MKKNLTKNDLGWGGFIYLTLSGQDTSLRKVRTDPQDRHLKAGSVEVYPPKVGAF